MENENPQNKHFVTSAMLTISIDMFDIILFGIASLQTYTAFLSSKNFLIIASILLIVGKIIAHFQVIEFDEGHRKRETVLLDNSFGEHRIPNYNSDIYFNNKSIQNGYIKLLANVHENTLYTSAIIDKMTKKYDIISVSLLLLFLLQVFCSGMNDFSSALFNFIISGNFISRTYKLKSVGNDTSKLFQEANKICSDYEINNDLQLLSRKILDIFVTYENIIFASKITLSGKVFSSLNCKLNDDWQKIKQSYKIYNHFMEE